MLDHRPTPHEWPWWEPWQHWNPAEQELMRFDYAELEAATHNYCRVSFFLAKGTCGNLFRASLNLKNLAAPTAANSVAIEQLDPISCRVNQIWRDEVEYVGRHPHRYLLKLLGYACEEPDKALLIYEPIPEYTLRDRLFDLSWSTRLKIALDVARALKFLHGLDPPLIWRAPTIETSNILLDRLYNPKIFKIGLSTNCPNSPYSKLHATTCVCAAPEHYQTGRLTTSCNVYSFGVFLLQLISGREPVDESRPPKERILVDWARRLLSEGKIMNIIGCSIEAIKLMNGSVANICRLVQQCLERKATRRPSMDAVYIRLFCELYHGDAQADDRVLVDFVTSYASTLDR